MGRCAERRYYGFLPGDDPAKPVDLEPDGVPERKGISLGDVAGPFTCQNCHFMGRPDETFESFARRHDQQV